MTSYKLKFQQLAPFPFSLLPSPFPLFSLFPYASPSPCCFFHHSNLSLILFSNPISPGW